MASKQTLQVTSGQQWRKVREEGELVPLPSGHVVRLRTVGVETLIRRGRIPQGLLAIVADALMGGAGTLPVPQTVEEMKDHLEFYESACIEAFVSPRIVETPQAEDEISIEDVSLEDLFVVVSLLNKPVRELIRFREEQARNVGNLQHGDGIRPEAEPATENHA